MADYFTHLSMNIDDITPDEAAWFASLLAADERDDAANGTAQFSDEPECGPEFLIEFQPDDNTLWVTHDESATPSSVAAFLQAFLVRFRPDSVLSFEWSDLCSRPIIDAFGGGGCVVTATEIHMLHTSRYVVDKLAEIVGG